jgi:hypothetical protein
MKNERNILKDYYGDEVPAIKDFLVVTVVFLLLTALS